MERLLPAINRVPDLIRDIFTGPYALPAVLLLIVYLVVLFMSNKVSLIIREFLVPALVIAGGYGYFKRKYPLFWLMLFLLLVLLAVRLLRYLLINIRQNHINRKIERRALEKARARRGSWKDKRGHSGRHPVEEEEAPAAFAPMDSRELNDVVENETAEHQGAQMNLTAPPLGEEAPPREDVLDPDAPLARTTVLDAIRKLEDLRSLGVLTAAEVEEKRGQLYRRMG